MGNQVIAERMYRYDLAAMLHARPGTAMYADNAGRARPIDGQRCTASSGRAGEIGARP
jgi:hypothetical protein